MDVVPSRVFSGRKESFCFLQQFRGLRYNEATFKSIPGVSAPHYFSERQADRPLAFTIAGEPGHISSASAHKQGLCPSGATQAWAQALLAASLQCRPDLLATAALYITEPWMLLGGAAGSEQFLIFLFLCLKPKTKYCWFLSPVSSRHH